MSIDCVVLDFDGTFTDVHAEAAPFKDAYRKNLADVLGRDVSRLWEEEELVVTSRPGDFGWEFGGRTVAPATADPYLLSTAVAQRIFDRLAVLSSLPIRTDISQALYRESYKHTAMAFKEDARAVLETLLAGPWRVYVVTNSNPDVVGKKIDELAPKGREKLGLHGDAKKYVVVEPGTSDERFDGVSEKRQMSGLDTRPIYYRRGKYYEVLRDIWKETGSAPERTIVCGDIWELDLSLPQELGAYVHLIERPTSLQYEREAIAQAGKKGSASVTLTEFVSRLQSLSGR